MKAYITTSLNISHRRLFLTKPYKLTNNWYSYNNDIGVPIPDNEYKNIQPDWRDNEPIEVEIVIKH